MSTIQPSSRKRNRRLQFLQIGVGIICIVLPSLVLGYPGLEDSSIVLFLSIALFAAGIERISTGIFSEEFVKTRSSRISYIGLGAAIIALPVFAIAYPEPTEEILIIIVAAALLLSGIAAIIRSIKDKNIRGLRKALILGLGILSTGLAVQALLYPALGLVILMLIVSVGLLVNGIEILALGLTGRRFIFNQEAPK